MQYLLMLTFRQGEGPQEGTPEFDAEMVRWGELNAELRAAGAMVAASGLHVDATTTVRAVERVICRRKRATTCPPSSSLTAIRSLCSRRRNRLNTARSIANWVRFRPANRRKHFSQRALDYMGV